MKLKGKISILINREYTTIEVEDENANCTFLKINLTPEQLSMALSRQMSIDCELDIIGLDKIGKRHENKKFAFAIPKTIRGSQYSKTLQTLAQSKLEDGWIADNYFGSQDSFYTGTDNTQYARCTIRRWI